MGKLGLALVGKAMFSKSLIQFSADGWGCNLASGRGNGDLLQKDLCQHSAAPRTVVASAPDPAADHCQPPPPPETPGHSQASLAQSFVGSLFLFPESWCPQHCVVPSKSVSLEVLSPIAGSPGWEICCGT